MIQLIDDLEELRFGDLKTVSIIEEIISSELIAQNKNRLS